MQKRSAERLLDQDDDARADLAHEFEATNLPFQPPNRYVYSDSNKVDRGAWEQAVSEALRRDRLTPDSVCFCSKQDCGDREAFFEYRDAAVGVYRDAKLLRFVFGFNDAPEGTFDIRTADLSITSIRKIILRKRSTPPWQSPVRDSEDNYNYYDFYYQTRIYTASNAHYAPRGEESHTRLIDARYVCDWLCENTGLLAEQDTQAQPLDGYPEGV